MAYRLIQLIINPDKAWENIEKNPEQEQATLLLAVYPMLLITALSAFIHYWYGYVTYADAVKEALLILLKYIACLLSALSCVILLSRYNFIPPCSKKTAHTFAGYTFTISLLSVLIGNILPSSFTFVQFIPAYIIWVVYAARHYLKVPAENNFSFTIVNSAIFLLLPFVWDKIFGLILH